VLLAGGSIPRSWPNCGLREQGLSFLRCDMLLPAKAREKTPPRIGCGFTMTTPLEGKVAARDLWKEK
jgi:hypothetical protein